MLINVFDWQLDLWDRLVCDLENLPHAILLAGSAGLGKQAFAQGLAARLLCEQPEHVGEHGFACGICTSCAWLGSDNHPDFRLLRPDDGGEGGEGGEDSRSLPPAKKAGGDVIRVDQVRALSEFVYVASHRNGNRVVVISPAEAMNPAAANSLLKILEEPPAGVYFIMISDSWRRLLPTLRSRCRSIVMGRPDQVQAQRWLAGQGTKNAAELLRMAGGSPLLAVEWAEQGRLDAYQKVLESLADKPSDPVAMAAKWSAVLKVESGFGMPQLVEAIQKWVFDLMLYKASGRLRYHDAWRGWFAQLTAKATSSALMICHNDLLRIRAVARHPLNSQLLLEDLATRYLRSLSPRAFA